MDSYETSDWEIPGPNVHTYGTAGRAGRAGRGRRDPQLVADPTVLTFGDYDSRDHAAYEPKSPVTTSPAYGAVNPSIMGYAGGRPVYVDTTATMRESYCVCARTDRERRMLLAVVVLAVLSVGLLATLLSLLPSLLCSGDDCDDDLGLADLLPIMASRLGDAFS